MGLAERLLNQENSASTVEEFIPGLKSLIQDLTSISLNIKVFVFGSVARKEMTKHSDIDLLVVLEDSIDKKQFRGQFYKVKKPIGRAVDIVFKNSGEVTDSFFLDSIQSELVELFPEWKLDGQ